jgi:hypothetical protein
VRAPRQLAFHHSLPVRPAAGAGTRTQSTTNGEHHESVLEPETGPRLARAPVGPVQAAPRRRLALVLHRHTSGRAGEHESGSTPRIREDGSIPAAAATDVQPDIDLRRADAPGRPSYRDRSGSSRSSFRSCIRSRNVMTGLRGGGSPPASSGGASQPSRTASGSWQKGLESDVQT